MTCSSCGSDNKPGTKFCVACGAVLARACPSCGTAYEEGQRFCGECGAALAASATPSPPRQVVAEPAAERRLVSILFADLVGFTALSETRDAEEVRELLSRYFETSRRLIELYGGTVEKFIGDAVMAVWGTPTATEDDAERAVRAALDLVTAVRAIGDEVGAPDLQARAGVLTGEAAVTLGAEGEGMVAGDLVNTASRIQSVAAPGTVYVGDSTRRATEPTIVYEDAGARELKGKEEPVPLWRALRVVSGVRGSLKSEGLEAPFVGRDRELRQIKDLFHTCADEQKAHLVSVTGIAGIGKSRLGWEFYKYFDGIAQVVYWHRGRCLAYGDGVTYWALADMVRMRCRIGEDEEPGSALRKLESTLEEHLLDADERAFVEPRLAHLLGLADHQARDRQDLFAAWRLFFERLAATYPTVLAFEDMQWADASLLDFVEYLLEWSRNHPIFVVTLARPELLERRATWGAGHRNFTSLYLEPLGEPAMQELLGGLVPGLPPSLRDQILARAEGVPLYAVETVRMLLDRGLLVQQGSVYTPVGEVSELEIPETLHALIAARLDGLTSDERRVLQDAAVLGKTFTLGSVAALVGEPADQVERLLQSLVRKEVLSLQADPRSPEHGQYGFLQDLVRRVAYETIGRRERRARHLAAAEYLEASIPEDDEIVEVLASHYVRALEALPDADDAPEIKRKARDALARAGERASSLAAAAEACRYFEQAAAFAEDPREQARLLGDAGRMARRAGAPDDSERLFLASIALYEGEGDTHAAARVATGLAQVEVRTGRLDSARIRMERAFEVIAGDEPDEDLAVLAAQLAVAYWFSGDLGRAVERAELALDLSEALRFPEGIVRAMLAKAGIAYRRGHTHEALAFHKQALEITLEHDLVEQEAMIYVVLSDAMFNQDRYSDALAYLDEALALARRLGNRPHEWSALAESTYPLFMTGRWDESLAVADEITEERAQSGGLFLGLLSSALEIHVHRGELEAARQCFAVSAPREDTSDVQERVALLGAKAALLRGEGRLDEALAAGMAVVQAHEALPFSHQSVEQAIVEALEAAHALGDLERMRELMALIDDLSPGERPRYLAGHADRVRGSLDRDESAFEAAVTRFRELGIVFWLGVTLLEHTEFLVAEGRRDDAEPLAAEALEIFESLRAIPWVERATSLRIAAPSGVSTAGV